jgi:Family of unknown function (DUF5677)
MLRAAMLTFLGMEPSGLEACAYSSRVVDEDALARATSDAPFSREAVAVLEELLQSTALVARVRRVDQGGEPRTLTRDEAILAGQMVRLAKLHEGLLAYYSPPRMELFAFVLRGAIETAVNLRYLLEHGSREVFDAYIHDSLRLDKQLHERINEVVRARGGMVMPMEYGMLEGVERAFRAAGVELDSVDGGARPGWTKGGVRARFKALGLEGLYGPYFAVQSNYAHGAWQELYEHHLTAQPNGEFLPRPEFDDDPGVSPLVMAIDVLAGAAVDYLRAAGPESPDRDALEDRIAFCAGKGETVRDAYRRFRGMPV